jgi:hypothetical protein
VCVKRVLLQLDSKKNDCCKGDSGRFSLGAPPHSDQQQPNTPAGAIAGAVVGGVTAIVILSGVGFWFVRQKRQRGNDRDMIMMDQENEPVPKSSLASGALIVEADAGPEHVLVESDAQPIQPRVLHELPA